MKEWDVTIEATVRKTVRVQSPTRSQAIELAHEQFSVLNDDSKEQYTEETVEVEECGE